MKPTAAVMRPTARCARRWRLVLVPALIAGGLAALGLAAQDERPDPRPFPGPGTPPPGPPGPPAPPAPSDPPSPPPLALPASVCLDGGATLTVVEAEGLARGAATAIDSSPLAVAVVDRVGDVLALFRR